MSNTGFRASLALAALIWVVALFVAPWVASRPSPGTAAYIVSLAIYKAGSFICHQRPERSFYLWDAQLPVCARCVGIYAGALGSAFAAVILGQSRSAHPMADRALVVLAIAAIPTMLTLLFEWTTGATPANWTRALSGVPLGAMIAWLLMTVNAPREAVGVH